MVKVSWLEDEPIIIAATAVKVSQAPLERSIEELYEESRNHKEESIKLVNKITKNLGHKVLADFLPYAIALEDMSRFSALYFWRNVNANNLVFGAGLEASLRVVKPNRYHETVGDLGKIAFEAYNKGIELGIPEQDARYMLPEGTLTRMIFSAPPRYLMKLSTNLKKAPLHELKEIGEKSEALIKEKFNLEIVEESLPSEWKFWGEEKIEKGISLDYEGKIPSLSLNMRTEGSLAMYAQLVRQRQFLCEIEPLEATAKKKKFVKPPTFSPEIEKYYKEIASQASEKQMKLIENRDPSFVYFLLLGQAAEGMVYGKGAGVIETSKARSCGTAQWEIRNVVGIPITRELAKYGLEKEIGPRCWREGKCTEPATFKSKKNLCKAFAKYAGKWEEELEDLLKTLEEPYKTFRL